VKIASHHLESLDVFRGLTIAAMILVNNPGDWGAVFPPLLHAYWTGITFADVVFPWFIFILGFALPFAFARRHEHGHGLTQLHRRILQRVAWLFVLGLALNAVAAWPHVAPLRIPGILQRIALTYLVASLIVLHLDAGGWVVAIAACVIGHWALLTQVPFDGFPAGTLTPDHSLARYVDVLLLGPHAITRTLDPEGLLGVVPSIATALIGASIGDVIRRAAADRDRIRVLLIAGAATLIAGAGWSRAFPLSKPLWTGSYVLVVTGLAMLMMAALYATIDVSGWRSWARPFVWLGVNPLAIYFLSDVTGHLLEMAWIHQAQGRTTTKGWIVWGAIEPALRPLRAEWASLTFAVGFTVLWIAVAGMLYRRRIRIQV
jgi:predicted acyltransferase